MNIQLKQWLSQPGAEALMTLLEARQQEFNKGLLDTEASDAALLRHLHQAQGQHMLVAFVRGLIEAAKVEEQHHER